MTAIIAGTNRANSMTGQVARIIQQELRAKEQEAHLLDLAEIKDYGLSSTMYAPDAQSAEIKDAQDTILMPSDKWIVLLPEYNGGVPGIFKLLIDAISVRDKDGLKGKNVLLIGIAAGRAGNLRGLDYMTNCLNYLGMNVHAQKMPISQINGVLKDGKLEDYTAKTLNGLVQEFLG